MKDVKKLTYALLIATGSLTSTATMAKVATAGSASTGYVHVGGANNPGGSAGRAGISMPTTTPPTTNPSDQSFVVGFVEGPLA